MYRVADTKGALSGRVFVKGILYRVADTKGVLRGGGGGLRVYCIVSRIPRVFYAVRGFCQWYIVLCCEYQGWFEVEGYN